MTNIEDGSAEHATHSSGDVRANSGGAFANLTHLPHLPHLTGKDSLGSDLHPTSRNAPREPATVDDLIGSSAASPSEPAPSLRPVEEIERDLAVPEPTVMECFTDTPAWYAAQHRLAADIPALLARLRAAEETLAEVGALHRSKTFDGYADYHHAASIAAVGAIAPYRHVCTEECFERFTVCAHDGQGWPCPTAAALAEGASR